MISGLKLDDRLKGNVSLISSGSNYFYVEEWNKGSRLFYGEESFVINRTQVSCVEAFSIAPNDLCVFVSEKNGQDKMHCRQNGTHGFYVKQEFLTTGSYQVNIQWIQWIQWYE